MTLIMLLTHFTAFPPLPFTPHLCEQYPKDLRFSPVITDTQPAHLSKYLLSNQALLQSLPEICVDSSHSKQKKCRIRTYVALEKYSTKSLPVERHVDMEQTGMNHGREDLGEQEGSKG